MRNNDCFIEYFMMKFHVKEREMMYFLDEDSVQNLKECHYKDLPEKVHHRFFNFFKAKSFEEIYEQCDGMSLRKIKNVFKRFYIMANTRHNAKLTGVIDHFAHEKDVEVDMIGFMRKQGQITSEAEELAKQIVI